MTLELLGRRGVYIDIAAEIAGKEKPLSDGDLAHFEDFDLIYRSTCAMLYNYAPLSGHPGGSVSSGRFVAALLFDGMDYDLSAPARRDADILSYAAGHKALGLYAMWALRNEIARQGAPALVPERIEEQMRLEDLLGFRRNPRTKTPLFVEFGSKPLDGHPTPATPFVKLATGASGIGDGSSIGLAYGAADLYGEDAPWVHIVEGEGGLTPGRVAEAMAAAATASLGNVVMHIDWNQASIDSDRVCRNDDGPGDYVQWNPIEFAYVQDWNVIRVEDGTDFQQIIAAQRRARTLDNGQPTAIVYVTTKGWRYGIEGKASHGAGHKQCSPGYYEALRPLCEKHDLVVPTCDPANTTCNLGKDRAVVETCYWEALTSIRGVIGRCDAMTQHLAGRLEAARDRLDERKREPRSGAPDLDAVFAAAKDGASRIPDELVLEPGTKTTLRGELGRALDHLNRRSGGALFLAAADLAGSTSIAAGAKGFDAGFYHRTANPGARLLSIGGICEDAMMSILSGLSTYGAHLGAGASYGAFLAALGHISCRLHAIGNQARREAFGTPYGPMIMVCAHAGLKTGEDGPTHADPQPLQLLQGNFPPGAMITLTPWDPQEIWPLLATALGHRPAVIAPFVTRPNEPVLDRAELGLAPATAATSGVYRLRASKGKGDGVVVLQGSGVTNAFVQDALPRLDRAGIDLDVYYVASAELFDLLPRDEQERIFPARHAEIAMGITGLTLPTMYRWVTSPKGRAATMFPYQHGHYLGSGPAEMVLLEAGLDGESQFEAVRRYVGA